jgi:hypothetical protein
MRKHPWLHQRGGTFYLRAIVPIDLVSRLGCREVWRSLRTRVRSEANSRVQELAAAVQRSFEVARSSDELSPPLSGVRANIVANIGIEESDSHRDQAPSLQSDFSSENTLPACLDSMANVSRAPRGERHERAEAFSAASSKMCR